MDLLIILILILISGTFALTEIAVVASREARLKERLHRGDRGARIVLELKAAPNRFLSATQIGITLVSIVTGAFGGASTAERLAEFFRTVPLLESYASSLGMGVVVATISYLTLLLGELVPKRLALSNPEGFASALAPFIDWLAKLMSPIVSVLTGSTQAVIRLLGVKEGQEPPVTDEEIRLLMAQGAQAGVFEELESEMVNGILRLGEQRARTLMTPRHDIVWLDLDDPMEENVRKLRESGYSRFPVCRDGLDNVMGMAYAKDLLARLLEGRPLELETGLRDPLYIPETMPALEIMEQFRDSRIHVALVLDEYGGVEGLITLRDLLEGIIGELPTVGMVQGPRAVQRSDGSWLIDGDFPADNLEELLGLETLPYRDLIGYETVAGLILALLDHIPQRGESVVWEGWRFEVMDMDGLRIDQVLVTKVK